MFVTLHAHIEYACMCTYTYVYSTCIQIVFMLYVCMYNVMYIASTCVRDCFHASIIIFSDDRVNPEGITNFAGWARMALPITTFSIVEVSCTHNTCFSLLEICEHVLYVCIFFTWVYMYMYMHYVHGFEVKCI